MSILAYMPCVMIKPLPGRHWPLDVPRLRPKVRIPQEMIDQNRNYFLGVGGEKVRVLPSGRPVSACGQTGEVYPYLQPLIKKKKIN